MTQLASAVIIGLLLGGLYTSIALGLSLVFGVMKLMNVAYGDFVILGSYLGFGLFTAFGFDPVLSLVIIVPAMFGLGWLVQRFLLNRAFRISMNAPLIITIGISLLIQNITQVIWSPSSKGLFASYALQSLALGPINIPLIYVLDFIVALVMMFLLREFLRRTYLGMAITASSQHENAALLMGIDTSRIYIFTFALSIAFAAVSGIFLGLTYAFVPSSGITYLIIAFGVVIMGGLGNILGTLIGGMVFGLAQTMGGYFLGVSAQFIVAYLIVFVILAARPQGIFGR